MHNLGVGERYLAFSGVKSIGMANKHLICYVHAWALLIDSKHNEATFSMDLLCL